MIILIVCIIAILFLILNFLLAPHNPYQEKYTSFECGFHSFHQTRSPFDISFFIYALVYLILDLEILLLYPYAMSIYSNEVYGLLIVLIFILIITIGFIFELGKGALKINSRQGELKQTPDFKVNSFKLYSNSSYPNSLNHTRKYSTLPLKDKVVPVKVYSDADTCKTIILSDNKGKSGIYRWINITNGKSYIGSTVDLKTRFISYFNIKHLIANDNMLICRSLIKYGYSNFRLEILEYCDVEVRIDREFYYINLCSPEYNIIKVANYVPSKPSKTSNSAKLNTGLNHPNRIIVSVTDNLTGKETIYDSITKAETAIGLLRGQISQYFSKEQKKPLRKRYILKKIIISDDVNVETEEQLVESWRAGIGVEVVDITTNEKTTYLSIREAARALNMVHSTISNYMKTSKPYQGRYLFKKID